MTALVIAGIAAGVTAGSSAGNPTGLGRLSTAGAVGRAGRVAAQPGQPFHGLADAVGGTAASKTATPAAQQHPAQQHRAPSHPRKPARPRRPYIFYDSVNPGAIPPHHVIATYANGSYAVSRGQVAGRRTVFWIDTNGSDPAASVLDIEPGDATPSGAATWVFQRLHARPHAIARLYTMQSEWPAVRAAVSGLPTWMRQRVRYWIADPTGVPHILPGAAATQWYWGQGYDISTAKPGF